MIRTAVSMVLLIAAAIAGPAGAQSYPAKPVRVIVPAGPGDSCDVLSRLIGQKLGEKLGQQFTVDNRVGAGGQIGLALLAKAPADGYTIGCGQGGNMVLVRSEEHTSELQSRRDLVCRLLLEKKKKD